MALDFTDKVVVVTGGSVGIGLATGRLFASLGARVALVARSRGDLDRAVEECGERAVAIAADLSTDEGCELVARELLERFDRLDVLVNNAGRTARTNLERTDMKIYDEVFNLNVRGVYNVTRLLSPALIAAKGCIINVSSISGTIVQVGTLPYSMAKAALDHFTRVISLELAPKGVRVNAVSPGITISALIPRLMNYTPEQYQSWLQRATTRIPMGEACSSEDVANAIVFLSSEQARLITGIVLPVDGGLRYGDISTYATEMMK